MMIVGISANLLKGILMAQHELFSVERKQIFDQKLGVPKFVVYISMDGSDVTNSKLIKQFNSPVEQLDFFTQVSIFLASSDNTPEALDSVFEGLEKLFQ